MIGDYINGRRQVCYSPVSMLFVMAVIIGILMQFVGVHVVNEIVIVFFIAITLGVLYIGYLIGKRHAAR